MPDSSFDKNIKFTLADLHIEPSANVWNAVEKALEKKKRRYFFGWWALPLLILVGGIVVYTSLPKKDLEEMLSANQQTSLTIHKEKPLKEPIISQERIANNSSTVAPKQRDRVKHAATFLPQTARAGSQLKNAIAEDKNPVNDQGQRRIVAAKTSVQIQPAVATDHQTSIIEPLHDFKNDSQVNEKHGVTQQQNDSVSLPEKMQQVTGKEQHIAKDPKEEKKPHRKWITQLTAGAGLTRLGTLHTGSASNEALFNNNSGSGIRTSNQYIFDKGIYGNAGFLLSRKDNPKLIFTTGVLYQFQHINVNRIYRVDSIGLSSAPSYSNIETTIYKESLNIHAIDIPILVRFSFSQKLQLSTGLVNRFQFPEQWRKYEPVLGAKQTYLPVFQLNPAYRLGKISFGPVMNIGLRTYQNNSRSLNFGLSIKYSLKN